MGMSDYLPSWCSQPATILPAAADEEVPADVDEPPERKISNEQSTSFCKSAVRRQSERNGSVSLLTRAFQQPSAENDNDSDALSGPQMIRRRSMMSSASIASTAELTSDGGLTSPARTNTPSPPPPTNSTFAAFAPYSFKSENLNHPVTMVARPESTSSMLSVSPKALLAQPVPAPRKRCISFMCDGKKGMPKEKQAPVPPAPKETHVLAPKPRTIKFACPGPKSEKVLQAEKPGTPESTKTLQVQKPTTRSPSVPRKATRSTLPPSRAHRDSTETLRRASQSPVAIRSARPKPRYIIADEKTIENREATRFHEFASGKVEDDDWIVKDDEMPRKEKMTINDTLKKENAIRQLGHEAEEEALEEEDDDEDGNDSEDENEFDDDNSDGGDYDSVDPSDDGGSDGNETDNEAGFADSDDESDGDTDFAFWTPGRRLPGVGENNTYRPSAHRTASSSSIDSLSHMHPSTGQRRLRRRPIKIRPGTPDLPDSTDFVCGTLDEDRPLEEAYVSCMAVRKHAKHHQTPQDIDPSFPTSEPENEEDEDDEVAATIESDEHQFIHGNFEESDEERYGRRRSTIRMSPGHSPRRLHSPPPRRLHSPPPPAKHRLRSPPPRKLFGNSPKRMRSPPPAKHVRSPPASPMIEPKAISFAPLGSRPGLTHTKSLPRTPNAFCRAYHASRLAAANGNDGADDADQFQRGAIDIVKGLEQKRQRRKEKFYQKHCNRKKGQPERKPQPGKGAERMRELGLLMAGKTGAQDPYMLSA